MYNSVPAGICKHFIPTLLPPATNHKMFGLLFHDLVLDPKYSISFKTVHDKSNFKFN